MHSLTWYTNIHVAICFALFKIKIAFEMQAPQRAFHIHDVFVNFFIHTEKYAFWSYISDARYSLSTICKYTIFPRYMCSSWIQLLPMQGNELQLRHMIFICVWNTWFEMFWVNSRRVELRRLKQRADAAWEWNPSNNKLCFYYLIDCILFISFSHSIDFWFSWVQFHFE